MLNGYIGTTARWQDSKNIALKPTKWSCELGNKCIKIHSSSSKVEAKLFPVADSLGYFSTLGPVSDDSLRARRLRRGQPFLFIIAILMHFIYIERFSNLFTSIIESARITTGTLELGCISVQPCRCDLSMASAYRSILFFSAPLSLGLFFLFRSSSHSQPSETKLLCWPSSLGSRF